jgi:hypothetical protein
MKRQVFKYELDIFATGRCSINVPKDSKVLHFDFQNDKPHVWLEVITDGDHFYPTEDIFFSIVGTGFHVPDKHEHIGTVQQGPYVWHLYQEFKQDYEYDFKGT